MPRVYLLQCMSKVLTITQIFSFHFIFPGHGIVSSFWGVIKLHFLIQLEFIRPKQEAAHSQAM